MTEHNVGLDGAQDALRAWCHNPSDLQDPSIVCGAFGAITATLEHIVELASRSAAHTTGTDDARTVAHACYEIDRHARAGISSLDEAYRGSLERTDHRTPHLRDGQRQGAEQGRTTRHHVTARAPTGGDGA